MIRFEHGMLVLDNTATKDDVNAINEFAEFVRNEEREHIIKLLEKSCDCDKTNPVVIVHSCQNRFALADIRLENK